MSIVAIAGVLFTSVLIGIITSAIETKIDDLKRGNSLVLEKGHIVILGFYPGECTLLAQLILAANGEPACVVIAEDMEREEMEQCISEALTVPKSFRIICRTVDITDPASLEKCSVETCKTIIVSPTDDMRTIKAVLAVSALLEEKGAPEIGVNALISKDTHRFPPSIAEANHISTFQTNAILAKMIAHSCTQTGLSEAFREMFNFEGSEFYLIELPGIDGMTFEQIVLGVDCATPAGLLRDGTVIMNPPKEFVFRETDKVLAQLAESPELIGVFREILSNEGNELYLKDVSKMKLQGKYTVRALRRIMLQQGYVLMGHLDAEKNSRFNLLLDEELVLTDQDNLIVLGEK